MKSFAIVAFLVVFAIFECAAIDTVQQKPNQIIEQAEGSKLTLQDLSDLNLQLAMCLAHGRNFNGRKTCQVGCYLACQQPGCGGFKECRQVPNLRMHKYTCYCNNAS